MFSLSYFEMFQSYESISAISNNQHIYENKVMLHNYDSLDQTQSSDGGLTIYWDMVRKFESL